MIRPALLLGVYLFCMPSDGAELFAGDSADSFDAPKNNRTDHGGYDQACQPEGHAELIVASYFYNSSFARTVLDSAIVEWSNLPRGRVFVPDSQDSLSADVIDVKIIDKKLFALTSNGQLLRQEKGGSFKKIDERGLRALDMYVSELTASG